MRLPSESPAPGGPWGLSTEGGPCGGTLADLEREAVARALAEVDGNRRRAAERLGIGLRTLYEKLKRYELG